MDRYAGKKAVIIGGTIGIGLATAKALVEGGADVLVTGRNEHNLQAARDELGSRARVVRSDTASMADINALGDLVQAQLGAVDLAFVNAGVATLEPFEHVTEASYDELFSVNTKGAFFTAQRLAPLVRDGGAFVFTTVTNATATPAMSVYLASKAAVRSFASTRSPEPCCSSPSTRHSQQGPSCPPTAVSRRLTSRCQSACPSVSDRRAGARAPGAGPCARDEAGS